MRSARLGEKTYPPLLPLKPSASRQLKQPARAIYVPDLRSLGSTSPGRGYASALIEQLVSQTREQGRTGVILTCKQELIGFYEKLGFELDGVSESTHGGAIWHDMTLHLS